MEESRVALIGPCFSRFSVPTDLIKLILAYLPYLVDFLTIPSDGVTRKFILNMRISSLNIHHTGVVDVTRANYFFKFKFTIDNTLYKLFKGWATTDTRIQFEIGQTSSGSLFLPVIILQPHK